MLEGVRSIVGSEHSAYFKALSACAGHLMLSNRKSQAKDYAKGAIEGLLRVPMSQKSREVFLPDAISNFMGSLDTHTPQSKKLEELRRIGEPFGKGEYLVDLYRKSPVSRAMRKVGGGCLVALVVFILIWWSFGFLKALLILAAGYFLFVVLVLILSKTQRNMARLAFRNISKSLNNDLPN